MIQSAAYASRMTTRNCMARKIITRTVIVPLEGGRYAPLPAEPTREEVVRCEANRSEEHSCIGPVVDHGKVHMCRCGWTWHV